VIKLIVQTYNGAPMPQALSAQFDELGGSIGRADSNQLVLPDPERAISRVHAQVVFRNGGYAIVDRGSNPVLVNGRPLGNGVEAPLQAGDQLQIGGYAIKVDAVTQMGAAGHAAMTSASDPFADLGGMAFAAPPPQAPRPPAGGGMPTSGAAADPLAAFGFGGGAGAAPAADPFGFGGRPQGGGAPAAGGFGAAPAAPSPAAGGMAIPDDWDPFAPDPVAAPKPQDLARSLGQGGNFGLEQGGGAAAPLIPDLGDMAGGKANTASSIDAMFGLGSSGGDPLANSILAPASVAPNMANHVDPMRSLNTVNAGLATAAPDDVSALNQPFMEAPLKVSAPAQAPTPPVAPMAAPADNPRGAVLSWDEGAQEGRTVIRPRSATPAAGAPVTPPSVPVSSPAPAAAPALGDFDSWGTMSPPAAGASDPLGLAGLGAPAAPAPVGGPAPAVAAPAVLAPAAVPAAAPTAAPIAAPMAAPMAPPPPGPIAASVPTNPAVAADQAALIAALREGLEMPTLQMQTLTPEFMKLLGQLVHEATKGTVELLVARAALKREVRAEVTMIVAKENNPLKFSPSVEVALNHLLSPPARGFMPPAPAMRDAYDDLRAHQYAFVAGMRAALEGVLKRFDPAVLEGKLTQKSMLSTLLPSSRKAKMWDVFTELYGHISAEASDDFHELFGKEFLRAYEEQIDQLQRDA